MAPTYSSSDFIARNTCLVKGPTKNNILVGLHSTQDGDGSQTNVLRPCVSNIPTLKEFNACFPRPDGKRLPFQHVILSDKVWSSSQQLRALPSFDSGFYSWYIKLRKHYGPIWNKASIERALVFCSLNLKIDLFLPFTETWGLRFY